MKKKVGIALAIVGGVAVVVGGAIGAFYLLSDKLFKDCFIGESDFDMLGY